MNAYTIVSEFERRIAEFAGAPYAVAVDCCTNAIFLSALWHWQATVLKTLEVICPAHTYISVPFAIRRAGFSVKLEDVYWRGIYKLFPLEIYDGAKRFRRSMYHGGFHCLSFHIKKHLPIGRGGMILTDNPDAVHWLKRMRYDGREEKPYNECRVTEAGYHMYMTPEQAARGLALMDTLPSDDMPDLLEDYPNLREMPVFQQTQKG